MLAVVVSQPRPYLKYSTKRKSAGAQLRRSHLFRLTTIALRNLDLLNLRSFLLDDFGRQRRILKVRRFLLPFRQCPAQELFDLIADILVGLFLINQQPRERRDRIGVGARRVGDRDAEVGRHVARRRRRRGRDARQARINPVARFVLQLREWNLVVERVNQLDVSDPAGRLLNQCRHAFIALAAESGWPLDRSAFARVRRPARANLRKVISENVRRAATVRSVAYHDVLPRRERRAWIQRLDLVVVPLGYFPRINVRDHRTRQAQRACKSGQIVSDYYRTHHAREVQNFAGRVGELLIGQRSVARADVNRAI